MLFDDLTESAKENAVQAFADYFDDEVSQRMLESIGNLETTRFIDVDVSKDADGSFSLEAEKRKTPCFADGNDVPPKPERLKQTDDTVDQLFCEEYNKAVRSLASSWNDIQGAMKRHPDALAALKSDDRFMAAWEKDTSDYGDALDAATDDDAEFARLGNEFKAMNSDVEDAVDDFADDDLKATQDALDRVAEVLSEESERYRTQDGVSKLSQEMGVDFDEDGEPTNLFEKTSSKSGDVEYALTRRIPAPVEMQEDTGVCPLCHSDAFDGRYCPVCGFHSDRVDDGEESGGKAGTLAYMLKSGTRKTAQGYDEDLTYSITELDQQTRGEVVDREREEMYSTSTLSDLLSEDWDSLNNFCDGVGIEYDSYGSSEYDWVRCVEDTGECHADTASDLLQMDIYEAEDDGFFVGVGMAERYNMGLKEVIALQNKALSLADSPEMDRLEDMGFFDGGDDRADVLYLICRIAYLGYTEDASSFSYAVDRYKRTLSVDGMNDDDVEAAMTLCDRLNGQMNEILDEYNEVYQSVCQEALDSGIKDIEDNEEYLTSYKGIVETLEANDARFTSDGTRVAARRRSGMRAPKTRRSNNIKASQMRKRNRTGSSSKYEEWPPTDCDIVNEAIAMVEFNAPYRDHTALAKYVNSTMDDVLSDRDFVVELADRYGVLPDSRKLVHLFLEQFWNEIWSYLDEEDLLKNEFDWASIDGYDEDEDDEDDSGMFREERRMTRRSARVGRGRNRNRRVR